MTKLPISKEKQVAIFLDRDGVVIEYKRLLVRVEDVRITEEVVQSLKDLQARGFLLIVVTNQSAVARGLISEQDLNNLHSFISLQLRDQGVTIDAFYYCPHHPHAEIAVYRCVCNCRKPNAGMIQRAVIEHNIDLSRSFLIGDETRDILAGKAAGVTTIFLDRGSGAHSLQDAEPSFVSHSMAEATSYILMKT